MQYRTTIMTDTPIRYYRLGESSGTTAYDESPNIANGTLHGTITEGQTGAIHSDPNTAMLFDGSTGYISLPTTGLPNGMGAFWSIEAWGKTANAGQAGYQCLVGFGNRATNSMAALYFYNGGGGSQADLSIFNTEVKSAVGSIVSNTWYHLVGTFDGTNINLYLNGAFIAQTAVASAPSLSFASIGADGTTQVEYFNGTIDEVAIYNVALSSAKVNRHYLAGINNAAGAYSVEISRALVYVVAGSLSVDSTIGKRGQAAFKVHTATTTHFQQYQQVAIYDQNCVLAFTGYITTPKEMKPGFQSSLLHDITCTDQRFLSDKRRFINTYTNKSYDFIVQDMQTRVLSQEGVTVGQIFTGPLPSTTLFPSTTLYPDGPSSVIPQVTFTYATCTQVLDAMVKSATESTGKQFYQQIDLNKQLWFVPYSAVINSTTVDGTKIDQVQRPPSVTRGNPLYRNMETLTGGTQQTSVQNQTFYGDGTTTSWTLAYALSVAPTITVNGGPQTVGVSGSSGFQFYWQAGSAAISQDPSQPTLQKGNNPDVLHVVYTGQYPQDVMWSDSGLIATQQAIDGTSGIIESADRDNTYTSYTAGLSEVQSLIARNGVAGMLLEFTTQQSGFAPGQQITVTLAAHGLSGAQMLIESVHVDDGLDGLNYWSTVKAVQGPYDTTWQDYFGGFTRTSQSTISVGV